MTTHLILGWLSLCVLANAQCNPLTAACPPINGLAASSYEIDFTKQTSTPANWTLADQAIVNYGANGAEFTFAKRYDAPYLWTSFYMLFGRIEVTLQAATGQGIVTGAVMMSDDLDEIDWEWSGSNFNSTQGKVQTNYFGKGQTGNYDRGTQPAVDSPTTKFHTYVLDWTKDSLTWSIDGSVVRSMSNNGATSGSNQYPQTPSRLHIGLWNGGDQSSDRGIVGWVGGYTDLTKAPYTAYVKSVRITNYNPCPSWEYPAGFGGKWQDVKCTNQTIATTSAPSATLKPTPANLPCNYTVAAGDYGSKIADKLGVFFSDLNSTNQPINWDKLLLGQILKVPGGMCSNGTTTSFNNTTMTSTSSSSLTSSSLITSSYTTSSASSAITSTSSTSTTTGATPTYTVASGDSGYRIAQKLGCSFDDMKKANPSCNWDKLLIGQKLTACSNSNLTSSTTSSPSSSSSSISSASSSSSPTASSSGSSTSSTSSTSGSSRASSSPSTPSSNTALASPAPTSCNLTYTVAAGDFGNKIAAGFGMYFNDLSKLNPGVNRDKLQVGQIINVPSKPPTKSLTGVSSACNMIATGNSTSSCLTYQVQQDDHGNSIAALFGIFFNDLSKANSGLDWDKLQVGQVLQIPGKPARTPSVGMGSTACSANGTTTTSTVASTTSSSSTTSSTSSSSSSTSSTQASSNTSTQPPASSSSLSQSATSMTAIYANPQSTISSSTTPMASSSASAPLLQDALGRACGYTVSAGDYGYKIADKLQCSFDQLNATNSGVDWNKLLIGAILKVPGSTCTGVSRGSSSSSITSQSTSSTSFSTSPLSTAQSATPTSTTTVSPSSSSSPSVPSSTSSSSSMPSSSSKQLPMPSSTGSSSSTSSFSSQSQSSSISSSMTSSSMSSPSSLSSSLSTTTMMCNRDNCLNNFMDTRYISSAYSFCTTYLSGSRASTTSSSSTASSSSSVTSSASSSSSSAVVALPPWIGNCKNDPSRVSSACRCLCTASAMFTTIGSNTMLAFNLVGNKVVNMTPTSMSTPPVTSCSSTSSSSSSTVQNAWVSFASKYYGAGSAGLPGSSTTPSATMTGENRYYGSHGDNRGDWSHGQGQFGQGNQWKRGASPDHDMANGAANFIIDNQHREQGQPHPVITQAPSTNGASKGLVKGKLHKREAAPEPDVTILGGKQAWASAAAQMSLDAASMQSQYQPQATQGSHGQGYNYRHGVGPKKREAEPQPQPEPEPEECDLFKTCTGSIPLESMIPAGGYKTVNGVLKGVGEVEGWASATTVSGGWAAMYTGTASAQTMNLVPHHGHAVNFGKREAAEGEAHKNPMSGQGLREHKHEHERTKPHLQAPAQRKREAEAEAEGGSGSEEHLGNGERPPWWKW